jgi:hypothetical protein
MTDFPGRRRSGVPFAPERRLVDPPQPPDTVTTRADRRSRAKRTPTRTCQTTDTATSAPPAGHRCLRSGFAAEHAGDVGGHRRREVSRVPAGGGLTGGGEHLRAGPRGSAQVGGVEAGDG